MSDYPEPIHNDELAVATAKPRLKKPPLYRVVLLNDDYTTMEFVIEVLRTIFNHSQQRAEEIMMHVHQRGKGVCGIYTREVAETKVEQTILFARQNQHPLQCAMEPESDDDGE